MLQQCHCAAVLLDTFRNVGKRHIYFYPKLIVLKCEHLSCPHSLEIRLDIEWNADSQCMQFPKKGVVAELSGAVQSFNVELKLLFSL